MLKRPGKPDIHYVVDDTDSWNKAPAILLQYGFARSRRVRFSRVPYSQQVIVDMGNLRL